MGILQELIIATAVIRKKATIFKTRKNSKHNNNHMEM